MASIDSTLPLTVRLSYPGRLERRYYLSLLSMALVDLLLSGLFLALSGKFYVIALRVPEVTVFLVVILLIGAHRLFAPLRHFFRTGEGREAATRRAATLGRMTTLWVIVVALLFTTSSFIVTPFLIFDIPLTSEVVYILIGRALAWVVLLPYVAIFVLQEYMRHLRRTLFSTYGILVPGGNSRLGRKLALVFVGGAVIPAVSIAITLLLVPPISPITGQPRSVVIITTIAGASIALTLAFWATQRSTTAGFKTLLSGMKDIKNGMVGGRVVIETDDELGRLGEGFNALSRQLELSRAETVRKEQERAQAARQFHEAQKRDALGRLAAGIAHDFNNILAIIVMYSDTVRTRMEEDDPNRKRLAEVLTAANRGKDLISQILDFTRDKAVEHDRFDLAANIAETVSLLEETVAKEVTVEVEIAEQPLEIDGDATGLHQVVANLCINAIHAMPGRSGTLRVGLDRVTVGSKRAEAIRDKLARAKASVVFEALSEDASRAWLGELPPRDYARISVADNGSGMSLETLRKVFDPYFTTKPVGEGTGLGLAAVAGIATAHGGGIDVETATDVGTTFNIYIPLPEDIQETDPDG